MSSDAGPGPSGKRSTPLIRTMSEDDQHWESFFNEVQAPENYQGLLDQVQTFLKADTSRPVVVVSSGGTTVPLETLTVRFVDNFSIGTRGAASAEVFLEKNYRVIFLHRQKSLHPFSRHVGNVLDILELSGQSSVKVKDSELQRTRQLLEKYDRHKPSIVMIPFITLGDYLWLLKGIASALDALGSRAMLYLAAAVSDFYVPKQEMPEHKIGSETTPKISFSLVPKMLHPLTSRWAPNAYIVSFKLETDVDLLFPKALKALKKYTHNCVIANLLTTRKKTVTMVERSGKVTQIDNPDESQEIEILIVQNLVDKHSEYMRSAAAKQHCAAPACEK